MSKKKNILKVKIAKEHYDKISEITENYFGLGGIVHNTKQKKKDIELWIYHLINDHLIEREERRK